MTSGNITYTLDGVTSSSVFMALLSQGIDAYVKKVTCSKNTITINTSSANSGTVGIVLIGKL